MKRLRPPALTEKSHCALSSEPDRGRENLINITHFAFTVLLKARGEKFSFNELHLSLINLFYATFNAALTTFQGCFQESACKTRGMTNA